MSAFTNEGSAAKCNAVFPSESTALALAPYRKSCCAVAELEGFWHANNNVKVNKYIFLFFKKKKLRLS
jgi:hypothetical protein